MENIMDRIKTDLLDALQTGFINTKYDSVESLRPKLLYNNIKRGSTILANIQRELSKCNEFWFSVAFITQSGLIVLKDTLKAIEGYAKGRILTTDYLMFNDPNALRELLKLKNVEVKVYTKGDFHTKGYMFKDDIKSTFIVGSANLTQNALKQSKEWGIQVSSLDEGELIQETNLEFEIMWNNAETLTKEWITEYEKHFRKNKNKRTEIRTYSFDDFKISPNVMQSKALESLSNLRKNGKNKALLISATGTGKTYLSAFDVKNMKPKRVLFLVHRELILKDAERSFKNVLGKEIKSGILSGSSKQYDVDYMFSTISMMSKDDVMTKFNRDHFDYIIIDEAHRSGANSYKKIIEYFNPKFMLGMTATPERTDGFDIYTLFDHNIAYEIRLQDALEEDMLCPFHYFGISELEVENETISDNSDFRYLVSDDRINHIIEKIEFYGYSGDRAKGLVFCNSIKEAKELSNKFNLRGYKTIALSGENSESERADAIDRLESDTRDDYIEYIFTVDIFNEGVDIPSVNQIVMLRPTQSAIIFVQQLGRGLRKFKDKEYVVVLDFIGNYTNNYLIPIALSGDRSYNKDNIRRYVAEGNRIIPGCSTVNFDKIARERIYEKIDKVKLNSVSIIKKEYFNLKYKLGRIPKLIDFEKYGSLDAERIFQTCNSYPEFLMKYDKDDYKITFDDDAKNQLAFISNKLANGKRIHDLVVMKNIVINKDNFLSNAIDELKSEFGIEMTDTVLRNVIKVLSNEFAVNSTEKRKNANCKFIDECEGKYIVNPKFKKALSDKNLEYEILEVVEYGIRKYKAAYSNKYKDTEFNLYKKYTYEDVCKLLNWSTNVVALNIGGYKYDEETNTFPIFINYNKDENINDTIKYEDRFINSKKLIAISKSKRDKNSKDMQQIINAQKNGTRIFLFVRKNKDDSTSKEFYFLGEMYFAGDMKEFIMPNTEASAVEISYELENPVREDIYDYITEQ
ncbi:DUF3427 domain-containing protein [Peptacetobacter hominis]|uniref:DUF3427 domain-containing protein n=2 Tax=Peptacetobacter hominis TaxID=2743610 RepID=A0A544QX13_9FIRM|nr:DUF3427 domain-containing protein [Peptacetobacter hominis]